MKRIIMVLSIVMVLCMLLSAPAMAFQPGRQVWLLDSSMSGANWVMEKSGGPNDNGQTGQVSLDAGASAIWLADQVAQANVTFTAGSWGLTLVTDSDWGTNGDKCLVEIGQWDGASFISEVSTTAQITYTVSGLTNIVKLNIQTAPVTIANGNWLALKITNNDIKTHVVHTGDSKHNSNLLSPQTDPGYPLPEIATIILLGAGVLGLGGYILLRRRKAATTA
ncbi:MAG TPA: hypothetical protein VLH15_08145 [Dehalococcoidales bacterium]|nr:hypothetical protein [Dehalococcoidales bacterium]